MKFNTEIKQFCLVFILAFASVAICSKLSQCKNFLFNLHKNSETN